MEIRAEFFLGIDPETNSEETERKVYPFTPLGFQAFIEDSENMYLLDALVTDANVIEF